MENATGIFFTFFWIIILLAAGTGIVYGIVATITESKIIVEGNKICKANNYDIPFDSQVRMNNQLHIRCCRNVIEDDDFVQDCAIFKKEDGE